MVIYLYPVRLEESLVVFKQGQTLTVNGEQFDFSPMEDGDSLPAIAVSSKWFTGNIDHVAGNLSLTLILPIPANFSPEQAFPLPLTDVPDGPVVFPAPLPVNETESFAEVSQ